jgi:hypothetical protein
MDLSWLFAGAFILSAIPLFFYIRYGEQHGSFDSIGTWYTVYSAGAIALVFAAAVVVLAGVARAIRNRSGRSKSERTDA